MVVINKCNPTDCLLKVWEIISLPFLALFIKDMKAFPKIVVAKCTRTPDHIFSQSQITNFLSKELKAFLLKLILLEKIKPKVVCFQGGSKGGIKKKSVNWNVSPKFFFCNTWNDIWVWKIFECENSMWDLFKFSNKDTRTA